MPWWLPPPPPPPLLPRRCEELLTLPRLTRAGVDMIMAAADEAGTGGLELLDCTRLLLPPPPLLLPLPMAAALLLFDRLSCLLFFVPDDRDDVRDAVLPNDATELLDDIRRIVSGLSTIDCVCALLC